jgi:hypothetical protein
MLGHSPGASVDGLYIPRGVVIPCYAGPEIWYLKISLYPGDPVKCRCGKPARARQPCPSCGYINKYLGVKGNRTAAIFGADNLAQFDTVLICEGEINAMTADQELYNLVGVCSIGGAASNHLDLATWGAYLLHVKRALLLYDYDDRGNEGAAYCLGLFGSKAKRCNPLPNGHKDINDYYQAGGDLRAWLAEEYDRLGLLAGVG